MDQFQLSAIGDIKQRTTTGSVTEPRATPPGRPDFDEGVIHQMGELSSMPVRGAVLRLRALWVAVATISACVSAGAATYYEEQGQLVRAGRSVTALGPDLFGDKFSLCTGATEFVQTNVLPSGSDALHMAVTWRLSSCVAAKEVSGLFGRWDFDLPRVQGSVLQRGVTQC